MATQKVIVTVAPTGGVGTKKDNPNLPTQPEEIAADVYRAYNEGASICAIHARRPDDQATTNPETYGKINRLIRERCNIILNNSTGGGVDGDMVASVRDGLDEIPIANKIKATMGGAEMCTFTPMTSMSLFNKTAMLSDMNPDKCTELAQAIKDQGIKPEWEIFNMSPLMRDGKRLILQGYDKPPYYFNFVLGAKGFQLAYDYTPKVLMMMIDQLPKDAMFCVSGVGPAQLPATTMAILLGGNVRVGLEDNHYYAKGQIATNQQLVARTVRLIRELGAEPATPDEAREILGLKPVAVVQPKQMAKSA